MNAQTLFNPPNPWFKVGAVILLAAGCGAIHCIQPAFFPKLGALLTCGDIDAISETLRSYGMWAMAASLLIDIVINILGFLPSIFISTANGVVFGLVPGIIISWLAECIGVTISFWVLRKFLRHHAERLIAKSPYLKKLDEFSGANGFKMMLIARSLPYFPSGLITTLGAVSRIRIRDYVLGTFIGKLPSVALEVVIGHDLVHYRQNVTRLAIVMSFVVLMYGGLWWRNKKKESRAPSHRK